MANITLRHSWQILQPLPSENFDPGQFIEVSEMSAKRREHAIKNIDEIMPARLELFLRFKK